MMLSALDLVRRLESGELKPRAAIDLCAQAIEAREKDVGAFVVLDLDAARRAADDPRLAGNAASRPAGCASRTFSTPPICRRNTARRSMPAYRPRADSSLVALTRRAGGIVIGKTVTTEMASLVPSVTRNPHNLEHTPGGSSAGSAAAVAAGMMPMAFGTQTAGSVIRPAAFCGVAGFKPSYRLIPMVGVKDVAWHLDTGGLFGASVADVAFVAGAILARDLRVDRTAPAAPRIAVARTHLWPQASEAMHKAIETAAKIAQGAGAKVTEITLPPIFEDAYLAQHTIQDYENLCAVAWEYEHHRDKIDRRLREALDAGDLHHRGCL